MKRIRTQYYTLECHDDAPVGAGWRRANELSTGERLADSRIIEEIVDCPADWWTVEATMADMINKLKFRAVACFVWCVALLPAMIGAGYIMGRFWK